jgi:holo-[acyl-carrier protein] synthase
MIVGIGIDLCRVDRISRSVGRFGAAWLCEVFHHSEIAGLGDGNLLHRRAAIGFAAKEACSKAIGTGFANGVDRKDFEVSFTGDECSVRIFGAALKKAQDLASAKDQIDAAILVRETQEWLTVLAVVYSGSAVLPEIECQFGSMDSVRPPRH